jgi:hypothetical protein
MRPVLVPMVVAAMVMGSVPVPAAEAATGSAVGRVTTLHKGVPAQADPTWKVRFTPSAGGGEPIDLPLKDGVYETPELPVGSYQVQLVDTFGTPLGEPQTVVFTPGAFRADFRVEVGSAQVAGQGGEKKSVWKVVAIVGGAAAVLALAAGGGSDDGGGDPPASPSQ